MNNRLLLLPCIAILFAFGLSACGGGGGGDETAEVEDVIETSAISSDPSNCKKLQTQNFMEQLSQESGKAAVKSCEAEAEGEGAKSVRLSNVKVDGSDATAEVELKGGGFDGQTVEIAAVKEGDQWKVDEIVQFTNLNQQHLVEVFEEEFAKPSNKADPKQASCFVSSFKEGSRTEIEGFLLSGSAKALEEAIESCLAAESG